MDKLTEQEAKLIDEVRRLPNNSEFSIRLVKYEKGKMRIEITPTTKIII